MLIYWGSLGLFYTRFEVGFWDSFSYTSKCLFPLVLEPNTSIQKESFIKSFQKWFSWVFHHHIHPCFSHTYLSFSLLYHSYRRSVVRLFLGDQSVVITKVIILVLRRQTCGFVLFRVLVRARCRVAASASLRACVCCSCGNKRGTRESKGVLVWTRL